MAYKIIIQLDYGRQRRCVRAKWNELLGLEIFLKYLKKYFLDFLNFQIVY